MKEFNDTKERIKFLRNMTGLTAAGFCEKFGVSPSSYAKWEAGILPISASKAKALIAIAKLNGISCNLSWLLYGKGLDPMQQQEQEQAMQSEEKNNINNEVGSLNLLISKEQESFRKIYKDALIMVICDNSMAPQFQVGEYVGGTKINLDSIKQYLDYPCIVSTEDGKTRLRRIGYNDKKFFLFGTNNRFAGAPLFEHSPNFTEVAPIFWHRMILETKE